MTNDTELFIRALSFAAHKHRNQRRKDTAKSPYINHPIRVAELLWAVGGVRDANILAAGLLHDTIEDTATTADELRELFGEDVLALVLEVTDDKSLPQQVRKQLQIEHSPHISERAKLLKLADKTCNLQDLIDAPPDNWNEQRQHEYLAWTERVVNGLRGVNPSMEQRYDEELRRGKEKFGLL